jgi:hypothetical protein
MGYQVEGEGGEERGGERWKWRRRRGGEGSERGEHRLHEHLLHDGVLPSTFLIWAAPTFLIWARLLDGIPHEPPAWVRELCQLAERPESLHRTAQHSIA